MYRGVNVLDIKLIRNNSDVVKDDLKKRGAYKKILILEDMPTDAELLEHELRKAGIAFSSRVVETRGGFIKELKKWKKN